MTQISIVEMVKHLWKCIYLGRPLNIQGTEEPGGLQCMGLQRIGHDCATEHTGSSDVV